MQCRTLPCYFALFCAMPLSPALAPHIWNNTPTNSKTFKNKILNTRPTCFTYFLSPHFPHTRSRRSRSFLPYLFFLRGHYTVSNCALCDYFTGTVRRDLLNICICLFICPCHLSSFTASWLGLSPCLFSCLDFSSSSPRFVVVAVACASVQFSRDALVQSVVKCRVSPCHPCVLEKTENVQKTNKHTNIHMHPSELRHERRGG